MIHLEEGNPKHKKYYNGKIPQTTNFPHQQNTPSICKTKT